MGKKYVIGYRIDPSDVIKREDVISVSGRFWSHAINKPEFEYVLEQGNPEKAKAVADILRKLGDRKLERTVFEVIEDE